MANSKSFFQITRLNISYHITTIISDTYIEKDSSINDEIDKLRHAATSALLERNDVIVVASVSCIFGLGDPSEYQQQALSLHVDQEYGRDRLLRELVDR